MCHLIDDSDWLDATDNVEQLLELLSRPEYELESLYQAMHKLFYADLRKDDDDLPASLKIEKASNSSFQPKIKAASLISPRCTSPKTKLLASNQGWKLCFEAG